MTHFIWNIIESKDCMRIELQQKKKNDRNEFFLFLVIHWF